MKATVSRREALLTTLAAGVALQTSALAAAGTTGRLQHSLCRGTFAKVPLDELCEACKGLGIESIELLEPADYPVVLKHGMTCAMGRFVSKKLPESHINCGWNRPEFHDVLVAGYEELIRQTAEAGFKKVICFAGARKGIDDQTGLENCARGLAKLLPLCERLDVTLCMELLNSRVNHPDHMGDNTTFGVALCEKLSSPRFRILYDIYHMQIMEGNLIATIRAHHKWFAHYHTAGVPGRHEIDDTQEIHYPAVVRAILETGYRDFLGQEFSPARKDKFASLKQAVEICTPRFP